MSLEYFGHDYGARTDPKLVKLRMKHGWAAVGIYWALVEVMHEQSGRIAETDMEALIYDLRIDINIVSDVLNEAFSLVDGFYTSNRIHRNLQEREQKRVQKVEAGRIGGIRSGITRTKQNEAQPEAVLEPPLEVSLEANEAKKGSKEVKEVKKERKDITPGRAQSPFIKPNLEQVKTYAYSIGANINSQAFLDHYESNGWKVGKNPMKSWQAAIRTWKHNGFDNTPLPAQSAKEEDKSVFSPESLADVQNLVSKIGKGIHA